MTLIERIWFKQHKTYWLAWPILMPLSLLFKWVSTSKRAQYQSGKKASYKALVPVIVVGNITVGGNGKTPVVVYLVEKLLELGFKPGVVSRGYGGKAPSYPYFVNEDSPSSASGDEPKLIATRTGVPVVVDPVRSQAVKLLQEHDVNVVVTDDGLQHYALERDIEIVVIDGNRRFGNEKLLPLGPLRESISRLNEVDLLITNGGQAKQNELQMSLEPDLAINLVTKEKKRVKELGKCSAFAGIGHPQRFFDTLNSLNVELIRTQGFADHRAVNKNEIDQLANGADSVLMTEKDAVKCKDIAQDNWWYLPVSAAFNESDRTIIENKILKVLKNYGS